MNKVLKSISIVLVVFVLAMTTGCGSNDSKSKDTVYEDMKESFDTASLLSSNIGIFSKTENDGSISYGECGSGVIFKKEDDSYYALTSAHVVSNENAQILVFTVNTEMKTDTIPGVDYNVLSPEVYDTMYTADVVYVSTRDDLAVIRFSCDEDLFLVEISTEDPKKGDRIMCIGNPQSDWFALSYGKVTSGMEKFGESLGYPSNVMKHSAYINVGSSGGAALNEDMKLIGIVPGGSFSPNGDTFRFGVLIPASEINICLGEWGGIN